MASDQNMDFLAYRMNVQEFAAFERILGQKIIRANGVYWGQMRPFFFRPLLPFQELALISVRPPHRSAWGGCQYAVASGEKGNSFLNFRMFDNSGTYSSGNLDYNRRRQVKLAARQFTIRPVRDVEEFKQKAYPVYLSFYERTRYQFATRRNDRSFFCWWADQLFQVPKVILLGGYRKDELGGISVSLFVEDTLCYLMFFCNTESLRLYLPDLMVHTVREMAAGRTEVKQVFAGMYNGGGGLDDFYLLRGCKIVRKPAMLRLNPLANFLARLCFPKDYGKLLGTLESASSVPVARDAASQDAGNRKSDSEATPTRQ